MIDITITLLSKNEIIAGITFDQGEYEKKPDTWVGFSRIRIGLIFIIIDFMKFHKEEEEE
jgi:hypothetical protein